LSDVGIRRITEGSAAVDDKQQAALLLDHVRDMRLETKINSLRADVIAAAPADACGYFGMEPGDISSENNTQGYTSSVHSRLNSSSPLLLWVECRGGVGRTLPFACVA
jgi:hypothetical protein